MVSEYADFSRNHFCLIIVAVFEEILNCDGFYLYPTNILGLGDLELGQQSYPVHRTIPDYRQEYSFAVSCFGTEALPAVTKPGGETVKERLAANLRKPQRSLSLQVSFLLVVLDRLDCPSQCRPPTRAEVESDPIEVGSHGSR